MKKFLQSLIVVILGVLISYEFYYLKEKETLSNEIYQNKSDEIVNLFNLEVDKKFGKTFAITNILSKDKILIEALLKKDNSLLDYQKIIEETHKYGEYKNLWIQIIDKDGYSFYRSWTKKTGDHAASARIDIADMLKNPRPMKGISTGRFDMTFKTMMPLYHEDEFIGMIEMISKFNSIATILKNRGIESLMVLHESYTQRFIKPFTGLFIDKNYIANLNASKTLMKKVQKHGLKKLMYLEKPIIFNKNLVTTTQIKDIHGGEMGFFIFFFKENELDKSKIYSFEREYMTIIISAVLIFLLIFLYRLNKSYAQSLEIKVAQKTKKLKNQQLKLEKALKIYDDNVIFSKTDIKGNITYVSHAFCEISGYNKSELINKPHNIVRHLDMSSDTFKEMWDCIKSGKNWEGEIKNQRKDGSYYWVFSKIEPIFDKGKVIGYTSTRTDITAKKEYEEQQLKMQNQAKMAAMGEMLANIAHQWRQPLSVITTIASSISLKQEHGLLKENELNTQMDHIVNSAEYLSTTIETFRNFLKSNKEYQSVSIQKTINEVLKILDTTIKQNGIELINKSQEIEEIKIGMIAGELEQVVINIVNNAKDIFIEKNISQRTIIIDLIKEQDKVILSIEDSAGGIPEEIIPKIFDAYFTTRHKSQGTGLGLYMSYKIMTESLKGNLYFKNTNIGAKFFLEIPLEIKAPLNK